jgi:kumamolisin
VVAYAKDHGLDVVNTDAARRVVRLSGTAASLSKAFQTKLQRCRTGQVEYRGRTGPLRVGDDVVDVISGVFGLDDRPQAQPRFRRASTQATSFTPLQLGELYDFPAGDGSLQTIGLIELGGGYSTDDLAQYFQSLSLTAPSVVSVSVDGADNQPTGDPNSADGEVTLDIEIAGALAPGATLAVYFAPNTDQGFIDAISTAIHDQQNHPSVISISWGGPESSWTQQSLDTMDQVFQDAGALGITVCVASGDSGSSDGVDDGQAHVDFPAASPNVLACGGTHLVSAADTTIQTETVWNDGAQGGASGGGISALFPPPTYQSGVGLPGSANQGAKAGRGVPDVAGDADPQTGYQILVGGSSVVFGGTSAVAPLWAALIARLNQQRSTPVGFLNPLLYENPAACRDITSGDNGAYRAGSGWDACTGLGSPNGPAILSIVGNTA